MSHSYFILPLGTPDELETVRNTKPLKDIALSNITHGELCDILKAKRTFVNRDDPTKTMETEFHTTIYDTAPIGWDVDELADLLSEHGDAIEHKGHSQALRWLEGLIHAAHVNGIEKIYVF